MTEHVPRIVRTSSDLDASHWMARQLPPDTSLRGYAEERAIATLTKAVQDAIENAGLSRTDVARLLGTTKSYISQVLNGTTNMTLKTLGALLWACGRQVSDLRTDNVGALAQPQKQPRAIVVLSTVSAESRNVAWVVDRDGLQTITDYHRSNDSPPYLATAQ